KVEAESLGMDRGATFVVILPALPAAAALPPLAPPAPADERGLPGAPDGTSPELPVLALPPAGEGSELAGLELLVVEDEPDTREILSEVLRAAGAGVTTAASLVEALAESDRARPDLLISDIAMPGGDGYALIRHLRRRGRERGGGVPAIAVSAHAREEDP